MFLTRTGQMCDDWRQEYILLSDVLGVSMLVDAINSRRPTGASENTVLGPFHVCRGRARAADGREYLPGPQRRPDAGARDASLGPDGKPLEGHVKIDVWQANDEGFYDVQQKGIQPDFNLRGVFTYRGGRTLPLQGGQAPKYYPIPDDGPVGQLLHKLGRHPYRPAHLHYIIGKPRVTTRWSPISSTPTMPTSTQTPCSA
jgi:protocatechuate 3,4-dioxygenase beta subunit